jgi:CO/xanthine dehydrogenase Mo-binding subunit
LPTATGRLANAALGDYLVPVSADVPDLDVVWWGSQTVTPLDAKSMGETGLVGIAASASNSCVISGKCRAASRTPSPCQRPP